MRLAGAWMTAFLLLIMFSACPPPEIVLTADEQAPGQGEKGREEETRRKQLRPQRVFGRVVDKTDDDCQREKTGGHAQDILDAALEYCRESQVYADRGEVEEAVAALDKAYGLILEVDATNDSELLQQVDDIRLTVCKRILLIHSSRYVVAKGSHEAFPLGLNDEVRREIEVFKGSQRAFFENSYRRSGRYRAMIVERLKKAGLPEVLAWLPLIESGFKVRAFSPARALGLWQFIPTTGYRFGLRRDEWIDERMNVEKATDAAIAYLRELHGIFGDWTTVLAAYNCGESRVLRVIHSQKIDYLDNFWDLYDRLPGETRRYVPRFLAALHILKDPSRYGISLPDPEDASVFEKVRVDRQIHLEALARVLKVAPEEMVRLNPELRREVTPPGAYQLRVPVPKAKILSKLIDKVPTYKPPRKRFSIHVIRRGETLSHLARRYRVSVAAITRANHIKKKALLRIGQKLKIPLGKTRAARKHRRGSKKKR